MEKKKFFRLADLILILVLAAIALAVFLPRELKKPDGNVTAVITQDGEVVRKIDLSSVKNPYTIALDCSPKARVTVEPGCIFYSIANCKVQICVNTGKLDKPGDSAACLPSRTTIRLESNGGGAVHGNGPDIISY